MVGVVQALAVGGAHTPPAAFIQASCPGAPSLDTHAHQAHALEGRAQALSILRGTPKQPEHTVNCEVGPHTAVREMAFFVKRFGSNAPPERISLRPKRFSHALEHVANWRGRSQPPQPDVAEWRAEGERERRHLVLIAQLLLGISCTLALVGDFRSLHELVAAQVPRRHSSWVAWRQLPPRQ